MPEGGLTAVMRALGESAGATTGERRRAALKLRAPDDAGILAKRRVEASRAPFEMAGYGKPKPFEIVESSFNEQPRGAALDLNALGSWDLAHYNPLERKNPTKVSERAKTAFSPENTREFERYVRQGVKEGGTEWYDMSPLSRVALQEMSPEDFRTLMAMNAATSARSAVSDQIKRASLAWYYRKQGIPWPMDNKDLIESAGEGYGHLAHDIHSKHLEPLVRGESPNFSSIDQPKYASYYNNFIGNLAPLTADTHYQALHGFPMKESYNKFSKKWIESPDFSKNVDYPFAEAFSSERARRMGLPPAAYQSAAWVGGKEATGVRDARPFAAVYDDLIARTAQQMDISPLEALKKHLRGELPLAPIERADGGAVPSLERYIRSRLPSKYASMPMRHLQRPPVSLEDIDNPERYAGSARDIYSLGDDKLVKLAKRPRGLYEMSLEGHPGLTRHLPGLDWRSPDNELAVVERMPLTPDASKSWMGPMKDRYEKVMYSRMPHVDDPALSRMMSDRGLDDFKKHRIHGPDFFNQPEHHWAMRDQSRPTLLDPGALDFRITNPQFEQGHARSFHDVISNRLEAMGRRPKPDELIEQALAEGDMGHLNPYGIAKGNEQFFGPQALFPPLPRAQDLPTDDLTELARMMLPRSGPSTKQKSLGFSRGGPVDLKFTAMRQRLAGGGAVRNWLRGVKGSSLDNSLTRLRKLVEENYPLEGDVQKRTALSQWIDKNLANYIVRQHGTEDDPLRALVGQGGGQPSHAAKATPAAELYQSMYGKPGDFSEPSIAGRHQMTHEPPAWLLDAARKDWPRLWSRKQYGEMVNDAAGAVNPAKNLSKLTPEELDAVRQGQKEYGQKYMRRLADPINIHDLDEPVWKQHYEPKLKDTIDYLSTVYNPRRPDAIGRMGVPDAVRLSNEWHAQMARRAEEAQRKGIADKLANADVYKDYGNGWKWVEMGGGSGGSWEKGEHPDAPLAQAIGAQLGHCYQNPETCKAYLTRGKLYSLIDPNGKAHLTAEATKGDHPRSQAGYNALPQNVRDEYETFFKSTGKHSMDFGRDFPEWAKQNYPELINNPPMNIGQFHGRQTETGVSPISEEAMPYARDFIRSGKWGRVDEAGQAGMSEVKSKSGRSHYMMPDEAAPFARYKWSNDLSKGTGAEEWIDENEWVKRNMAQPQWANHGEDWIRQRLRERAAKGSSSQRGDLDARFEVPDDYTPPPINFAAGGMVQAADFPREDASDALMRAQLSLKILLEEQRHATPEERPTLEREIRRVQLLIDRLSGARAQTGVKDVGLLRGPAMSGGDEGDGLDDATDMLGDLVTGDPEMDDFLESLMGAS